jgi:hypothetical protein
VSPALSRTAFEHIFAAALFACGFALIFRRWLISGFDDVLIDVSDGRILLATLEHWRLVFAGQAHWTDPSFFFPARGALALTDAFFLEGAAYAGLRTLGIDPFTAYTLMVAALATIGFFGFMRLARQHFGLATPWAAIGGFLFAFANLHAPGLDHAHLYCAMLLPLLCDLALTAWNETRTARMLALAAVAGLLHALIFLTASQIGWFFAAFLLLFALLHPAIFGPRRTLAMLWQATGEKRAAVLGYAGAFALGLVPFLMLYVPVLLGGHHRELAEVLSNAPDARDLFNLSTGNWLWAGVLEALGVRSKVWWEVEYGFTPMVWALLIGTLVALLPTASLLPPAWRRTEAEARDRWLLLLGLGAVISCLLQIDYFGYRPWSAVYALLPGASAIRYTYRSQLVANLFVALVAARGLEGCWVLARARRSMMAAMAAVIVVLVVEQANVTWPPTSSRRGLMQWVAAIPELPVGCRVFYLVPGPEPHGYPGWIRQTDAMLLSQLRRIPTVNGYSTWFPDHWDLEEPESPSYPAALRDWATRHRIDGLCGLDPARAAWTTGLSPEPSEQPRPASGTP